jgi:hypothetical protein
MRWVDPEQDLRCVLWLSSGCDSIGHDGTDQWTKGEEPPPTTYEANKMAQFKFHRIPSTS